MTKIEIRHMENRDIDILVEGKSYAKLLRRPVISDGYDIILDFKPKNELLTTDVGSLMRGAFIVNNHVETTLGLILFF